jgi:formylglycine-generating enzyme required for sulfatase activity
MALVWVKAAGCSPSELPAGGLRLEIGTDCTLPGADSLRIEVRSLDFAKTYRKQVYRVPEDTSLPASLAIRSNGDPLAGVAIDASLWKADTPLDVRSYRIRRVPTETVRQVVVKFSARCTARASLAENGEARSTCEPGSTCNPNQAMCESAERDGSELPLVSADVFPDCGDAGREDAASETSDARAEDGSHGLDASIADVGSPDAGCAPGATRCVANAVERCGADGGWATEATCAAGVEHCRGNGCETVPPSCQGAPTGAGVDCRASANTTGDCCASDEVPGGTFLRSFGEDAAAGHAATVGSFRLDDYEVTVGRFRQFVRAVVTDAWVPAPGAGKHTHLYGGNGLASGAASFESGWDPAWNAYLSMTQADWNADLRCSSDFQTWLPRADANERHPINCVNWYRAYAFCIWDGGFLPSEAEWSYAAAGGSRQRRYPWGDSDPGASADLAIYDCYFGSPPMQNRCAGLQNIAPVGLTSGRSLFGQWDLAGNMYEWTLDWDAPYVDPCVDCAATTGSGTRIDRGGGFYDPTASNLRATARHSRYAQSGYADVGIRCAREP